MPLPADYFASFEGTVGELGEFVEAVRHVSAFQLRTNSRFVWRGVAGADWPLYSSLVRRLNELNGRMPIEKKLQERELESLQEARDWSLDWHPAGGRLAALELLAALQHFGTPTRMLDFSFSPFIALWFAVEKHDEHDGRIFAIDIADRLVSRTEAGAANPWWAENAPVDWSSFAWVWRPPPLEPRIVRQDGCFLVGGIPGTTPARNVRTPTGKWRPLLQHEVQACMSVPFSLIQFKQAIAASQPRKLQGRPPGSAAFTLRVCNKPALREELERGFGYSPASLFPDFAGFRDYAASIPSLPGPATSST